MTLRGSSTGGGCSTAAAASEASPCRCSKRPGERLCQGPQNGRASAYRALKGARSDYARSPAATPADEHAIRLLTSTIVWHALDGLKKERRQLNSTQMTVAEILGECFDALQAPGWDPEHWDEHLRLLDTLTCSDDEPENVRRLAKQVTDRMRRARKSDFGNVLLPNDPLYDEIESALWQRNAPQFVYHGTIFGRLRSIERQGLVPGRQPVWKQDLRERCSVGVFLSRTWRTAAGFADWAHLRSRGPRDGLGRTPVVIRLPLKGFAVEKDRLAVRHDCVVVNGPVGVEAADVFLPPLTGMPRWRSLREVVAPSSPSVKASSMISSPCLTKPLRFELTVKLLKK